MMVFSRMARSFAPTLALVVLVGQVVNVAREAKSKGR